MMKETIELITKAMERQIEFYHTEAGQEYLRKEAARRAEAQRIRELDYHRKLEFYKNSPSHVVEETETGFQAWSLSSKKGKELQAQQRAAKREAEEEKRMIENPVEVAFEDIIQMGIESVSKIQIREALDKYCAFTVERMGELIGLLEEEEITVQ